MHWHKYSFGPLFLALSTYANGSPPTTPGEDAGAVSLADQGPLPQDLNGASPAAQRTPRIVEEIIVTAQKREENLQDVPLSISAFTAEQMDARGIVGVKDLASSTPGLQFTDLAGYTLTYLRGVGTDTFIPSAEQSVATYLDGVYFPSAHSLGQSFGALERIEVLKGPQGTLFGRNSTGGAINVITKDAGRKAETSVQASYGRFDELNTRVYSNIPLSDWSALSFSGFYNESTSYYHQSNDALFNASIPPLPKDDSKGARLKARISINDDTDWVTTALVSRQNGSTAAIGVNTKPSLLGTLAGIRPETRDYTVNSDSTPHVSTDINAYYSQLTWKGPVFDLKLIGSSFKIKTHDYLVDFDGSNLPIATTQSPDDFQNSHSGELQLLSNDGSWGSDRLKWVGGFYYYSSEGGYNPVRLTVATSQVTLPTGQLISLAPQALLDLLGPVPAPSKISALLFGTVGSKSYSGYLQATASAADWLDVIIGGRYQRETRRLIKSTVGVDNVSGGATTLLSYPSQEKPVGNFAPKLGLDFHLIDDVLLYLSVSRGFKSGTYNVVNLTKPPVYVKPEEVTGYELGLKSELLNGKLRFNGAIFENSIKNLQVTFVSLIDGGVVQFENAGGARIRGAEFDATWVVMPETNPGLVLTANGSYLDAIYTDFKNGGGFNEQTGLYSGNNDFSGNRISRVPRDTIAFGLSQTVEVPGGSLEVAGDYYRNAGFYFLAQNSPNSFEHSYSTLDARISYLYERWGMRFTMFGKNLTDERYRVSAFFNDFGQLDTFAPPRTYGVRLNWDF